MIISYGGFMSPFKSIGKWIEFRELIKENWHQLTDEEIEIARDSIDHFVDNLSRKYGSNLACTKGQINSLLMKIGLI
tara:strand:- start:2586 stop:2816 length:231 start_codon:yes stop_codon:yes gene_type:complete